MELSIDPISENLVIQKERTLGDGMDSSLLNLTEANLNYASLKMKVSHSSSNNLATFKSIEPESKLFYLVPKYVPKERTKPKFLIGKPKEPKFVPYEPYKGAVEPMVPSKKKKIVKIKPSLSSRNNVEIQELVTQMSEIRTTELNRTKASSLKKDDAVIPKKQWEIEKLGYETDIKNLRETNSHLENQLKLQAQVNSELKTLLVAAVGEDLESRVQHLTQDKLQLARALLNSANHLTSHQEQTEWLSGQCEVWRSKFLASSLMVEELARWKSALTARLNNLQETVKDLLFERRKIHKNSLNTYCLLQSSVKRLTKEEELPQNHKLQKSCNVVELSNVNFNLGRYIGEQVCINSDSLRIPEELSNLNQYTIPESNALKLLQNPVVMSTKQDAICNALLGTAMSLTGSQMYLQHPSIHATCCAHCTGEVKDL